MRVAGHYHADRSGLFLSYRLYSSSVWINVGARPARVYSLRSTDEDFLWQQMANVLLCFAICGGEGLLHEYCEQALMDRFHLTVVLSQTINRPEGYSRFIELPL